MKNSKFQPPSSREITSINIQFKICEHARVWRLKFGASLVLGAWCLMLLFCQNVLAQNYSIAWYKIAGGGGTSTNGQYAISGTIGQPDASGAMSGGQYSVTGGFWSLISVVQTPGAPTLTVTQSGNNVMVSWPSPSTGFLLQQNPDLRTANWTTSGFTVSSNSTTMSITIPSPTGNLFFRLKQ